MTVFLYCSLAFVFGVPLCALTVLAKRLLVDAGPAFGFPCPVRVIRVHKDRYLVQVRYGIWLTAQAEMYHELADEHARYLVGLRDARMANRVDGPTVVEEYDV